MYTGAFECYFTELEEKYGKILVSHLLAYISASKYGLSEPEIIDLIALDAEVSYLLSILLLSELIVKLNNCNSR